MLRRCIFLVALVPIIPATSCAAQEFIATQFPSRVDEVWWNQLLFCLFLIASLLLVIRSAVLWTVGRAGLSALIFVVPFVQIVFNKPLWSAGCISDDMLRMGQHQVGCGLWIWLSVWAWWGLEKQLMKANNASTERALRPPSRFLFGVTASLGIFPIVFGVWLVLGTYVENVLGVKNFAVVLFWTYLVCGLIALASWCLIWRRMVIWTPRVRLLTSVSWFVFVAFPVAGQFLVAGTMPQPWQIMLQVSPLIGWGAWMAATGWIWPMRVMSSAQEGPHCPQCQYPLTGLTHTRCPECGTEPTLDALWTGSQCGIP